MRTCVCGRTRFPNVTAEKEKEKVSRVAVVRDASFATRAEKKKKTSLAKSSPRRLAIGAKDICNTFVNVLSG